MKAHEILQLRVERLAAILKECRKNRGLSLEEFELQYGVSKSSAQRMEAGILNTGQQRWVDVLKALDPTPEETLFMITDVDPISELTPDEIDCVHRYRSLSKKDKEWIRQSLDVLNKVAKGKE